MAVVDRYRAALTDLVGLPLDGLDVPDLFAVLDAVETGRCQTPVVEHRAINQIARQATPQQIGKSLKKLLAERLRIRPGEARRRIADAEMLGARTAMTGEPLEPLCTDARRDPGWPATPATTCASMISTPNANRPRRTSIFRRLLVLRTPEARHRLSAARSAARCTRCR